MVVKQNEDDSIDKKLVTERSVGSEYLNPVAHNSFAVTKSNGDLSILTGQNIRYGMNYPTKPQTYIFEEEIFKRQKQGIVDAITRRRNSESTGAGIVHSMAYQYTNIHQVILFEDIFSRLVCFCIIHVIFYRLDIQWLLGIFLILRRDGR